MAEKLDWTIGQLDLTGLRLVAQSQVQHELGDYRNSARRPNAQKSQIFDLVKPAGHPPFLARPGQMKKKSRQKGEGVRTPPLFAQIAFRQILVRFCASRHTKITPCLTTMTLPAWTLLRVMAAAAAGRAFLTTIIEF